MDEIIARYENGIETARNKQFREAIEILEPLLASGLDFARKEHSRMVIGFAYASLNEWNKAAEHFKTAMLNDVDCIPARTALGHAYIMTNKIDEALELFRIAVQLAPNNAQAHHGLGWALLKKGEDLDEALYQVQEALRLDQNSAMIRDSLGWILYNMGDIDGALEQLEKAIELEPDHSMILEHRKVVRDAYKKRKERE